MVVSTFRGRFEDYDATLTAQGDGSLRLEGRVSADSISVKDDNLAAHLKAPDFFDTERHPDITFNSTLVRASNGTLIVDGELTIKGNSRPIEARGTITEPHVTLGDIEKVGIELEAIVDRTEYGLDWNAPLPKGGFALANEVKLVVELEFAKA
jgi:polyisoprenoid-binding protein YceI